MSAIYHLVLGETCISWRKKLYKQLGSKQNINTLFNGKSVLWLTDNWIFKFCQRILSNDHLCFMLNIIINGLWAIVMRHASNKVWQFKKYRYNPKKNTCRTRKDKMHQVPTSHAWYSALEMPLEVYRIHSAKACIKDKTIIQILISFGFSTTVGHQPLLCKE